MSAASETCPDDALDLQRAAAGGPSAALIRPIRPTHLSRLGEMWREGPLPVVQPQNATTRSRNLMAATTEDARRTLVAGHPADALYRPRGLRRHDLTSFVTGEVQVLARELWLEPKGAWGFVVVHVFVASELDQHLDVIAPLLRARSVAAVDFWAGVDAAGEWTYDESPVRGVSFADGAQHGAAAEGAKRLELAYALVTGATSAGRPDSAERAQQRTLTVARVDWSALVLRDGIGVVAHQSTAETFTETQRMLSHTIYVDALLLALLQRQMVDLSGDAAVAASLERPDDLSRLEKQHFEFKRTYWRSMLTDKRTSPADQIFTALQDELLTHADLADVEERVRTGARLARSLRDEQAAVAQAQLERTVQNASVVIGAFALAYTAAAVLSDPGVWVFVVATVAGLLGIVGAFAFLRVTGRRASGITPDH